MLRDHRTPRPLQFRLLLRAACAATVLISASPALAREPAEASVAAPANADAEKPWIRRHAPERNLVEFGGYGGIALPSGNHEFYEPDVRLPDQGHGQFKSVIGAFGARLGYYPLRHLGFELEGGAFPGRLTNDVSATMFTFRGHAVGQLGFWRITPFVLAGIGSAGVRSSRQALGDDTDVAAHGGGGAKLFVNRFLAFRIDGRALISAKRGAEAGLTAGGEVLFGLSFTVGRKKPVAPPPPPPKDSDGDGFDDPDDNCPDQRGIEPDGCPVLDSDGDGKPDDQDTCPDVAADTDDGCPIADTDGDGVLDPDDKCVEEPAETPDGCPIADTDGDGLLDPDDKCPDQPETRNGVDDEDGCPDELPTDLAKFTGSIEGIVFASGKSTIKPSSFKTLDQAVEVLKAYPSVRLEISGHTDDRGKPEQNVKLSTARAESVKTYFAGHGIAADRLEVRGAGPDEPLADNASRAGRAQNRRIEFKVLEANAKP